MPEPAAAPGTLLAGRYRLERPVSSGPCTTLWRAVDDVLARPVAVKILDSPATMPRCADAAEAISRFTTAATSVGRLAHPRIASTYDAGVDGQTPYIVTEWVEGRALSDVVRAEGPLSPAAAQVVAMQAADALSYAHDNDVRHGEVDGFNVLLCRDGSVKLTDFGVASALAPDRPAVGTDDAADESSDAQALASLLYYGLTGRSVDGADPSVPPAPRQDGVLLSPGQVRAGMPRELDQIVMRALHVPGWEGAPIETPASFAEALAELPPPSPVEPPAQIDDEQPHRRSSAVRVGVPLVLALVVVGSFVAATLAGQGDRDTPSEDRPSRSARPAAASASASASAPAAAVGKLTIAAAADFDPQGKPDTENPEDVALAYDGNTSTSWETDRYRTAAFGQLKAGVGIVFDLGSPVTVREVALSLPGNGVGVELRAADQRASAVDGYAVVASASDLGGDVKLVPKAAAPARYWLVWLTRLPAVSGGFKGRVAEVTFTGDLPR